MKYPFDPYDYYLRSVQSPENDAEHFKSIYRERTGKSLKVLGEDFCGTFAISTEWVKLNRDHKAIAVDLSPEPIEYGTKNYLPKLSPEERRRLRVIKSNVLNPKLPKVDCIAAMNFSFFIFKTRAELKKYFKNCYRRLPAGGLFICDCFGGPDAAHCLEKETKVGKEFSVFWDQEWFDPITHWTQFYLHFKPKGKRKYKRVFSYEWRMWSIPEIREVMLEAGFKKTYPYWEGTTRDGSGSGNFVYKEKTKEECDSWVALVVGQK